MITELKPGQVFLAQNQGGNITPITRKVAVHWVGPKAVHYYLDDDKKIHETSIERFLEIINQH